MLESTQIFIIDVNKILNNQYNISRDFLYPNTYSKIYDTSNKWKTPHQSAEIIQISIEFLNI